MCFSSLVACFLLCFQVVVSVPHGQYGINTQNVEMQGYRMQSPSYEQINFNEPYDLGEDHEYNSYYNKKSNGRIDYNLRNQVPQHTLEYPIDSKKFEEPYLNGVPLPNIPNNHAQQHQWIQSPETTHVLSSSYQNNYNLQPRAPIPVHQPERRIPEHIQNAAAMTQTPLWSANRQSPNILNDNTGLNEQMYFSNNYQDISSIPYRKRYMVKHSDGSIETLDSYEAVVRKYPNHVLIKTKDKAIYNSNQQEVPQKPRDLSIPSSLITPHESRSEANVPNVSFKGNTNGLSHNLELPSKSEVHTFTNININGPQKNNKHDGIPPSNNEKIKFAPKLNSNINSEFRQLNQATVTDSHKNEMNKLLITDNINFENKTHNKDKELKNDMDIIDFFNTTSSDKVMNQTLNQIIVTNLNDFPDTADNNDKTINITLDKTLVTTSNNVEINKFPLKLDSNDRVFHHNGTSPSYNENIKLVSKLNDSVSEIGQSKQTVITNSNVSEINDTLITYDTSFKNTPHIEDIESQKDMDINNSSGTVDSNDKIRNSTLEETPVTTSNDIESIKFSTTLDGDEELVYHNGTPTLYNENISLVSKLNSSIDSEIYQPDQTTITDSSVQEINDILITYDTSIKNNTHNEDKELEKDIDINDYLTKIDEINIPLNQTLVTPLNDFLEISDNNNKITNNTLDQMSVINSYNNENTDLPVTPDEIIDRNMDSDIVNNTNGETKQSNRTDCKKYINSNVINELINSSDSDNSNYSYDYKNITKDQFNILNESIDTSSVNMTENYELISNVDQNSTLLNEQEYKDQHTSFNNNTKDNNIDITGNSSVENNTNSETEEINQFDQELSLNNFNKSENSYEWLEDSETEENFATSYENIENKSDNVSDDSREYTDNAEITANVYSDSTMNNYNNEENNTSALNTTDVQTLHFTDGTTSTESTTNSEYEIETTVTENKDDIEFLKEIQLAGLESWIDKYDKDYQGDKLEDDDKRKKVVFVAVPPKEILSKDTRTTMYPNGVVIEEVRERIKTEDGEPPVIVITKIIYPKGTYRYT